MCVSSSLGHFTLFNDHVTLFSIFFPRFVLLLLMMKISIGRNSSNQTKISLYIIAHTHTQTARLFVYINILNCKKINFIHSICCSPPSDCSSVISISAAVSIISLFFHWLRPFSLSQLEIYEKKDEEKRKKKG